MWTKLGRFFRVVFRTVSVTIAVAAVFGIAGVSFFLFNIYQSLPEVSKLKEFKHPIATQVFSEDSRKIGEFTTERRYAVAFDDIPKHVTGAFVAAEDSNFYKHSGIDFVGIARAALSNVLRGRYAQGGSTITQQVARSILLVSRKKEITRKVREIILARRMEAELSKGEILNLYLNEIYLGHGAFGIGAAAQNYFHKKVQDLSIAEGALLAGLPQRPNEWNPFRNPHLAKARQAYVLRRMMDENFITKEQAQQALNETLRMFVVEDLNTDVAPYFTEYVRQYLMTKYGSDAVLTQGWKVYTTVNYEAQKAAEAALAKGLHGVDKRLGWRGVASRKETPEAVAEFNAKNHERILAKLTDGRLLPPTVDGDSRKLVYDLEPLAKKDSPYFGVTPLKAGEIYPAVVNVVEAGPAGRAQVQIGETVAWLPWLGASWVNSEEAPKKQMDQVLKAGDVVTVSVTKIQKDQGFVEVALGQDPEIEGALLSFDVDSGFVRAMVGGKDFETSKFNCALQAKRQVGSTFKPVIYAAALDKGFSPSSIVTDSPIVFKFEGDLDADNTGEDWRPHNYSGTFEGDIPLRLALIRSMNIPTVKLLNEITVDYGIEYARKLGITAVLPRDLSIGLGSWSSSLEELTQAYAVFPRLGKPVHLTYIKKVVDGSGRVLEEFTDKKPQEPLLKTAEELAAADTVISPQTAYVMTDLLKGVVREGTGRAVSGIPGAVAGKTGTSNDHRDAWFVGYTPETMTGVWVGYMKDKPLAASETGGNAAAPIWADFMRERVKTQVRREFLVPDGIVFASVDRRTGRLADSSNPNRVRVAFKAEMVPSRDGSNLLNIGEPGARAMSNAPAVDTGIPQVAPSEVEPEAAETGDYLRQGYDE
ncbi:PBP1A family penicillin-binding protein [bacterium]|nr:PBP1A family penicillin-binding protein [bacterium]